jgi:hypothetical protein
MDLLSFSHILYCIYVKLFCNEMQTKYIKLFENKLSCNEISWAHDGWHKNTLSFN